MPSEQLNGNIQQDNKEQQAVDEGEGGGGGARVGGIASICHAEVFNLSRPVTNEPFSRIIERHSMASRDYDELLIIRSVAPL